MKFDQGFLRSGKVRDLYALDDGRLLLVASDRLSAFDVVLPTPIPDKGRILTGLSRFWFERTADIVPNHLLATDPAALPADVADEAARAELRGRMMLCRRAEVLPVEVIVRGYLAGSGWRDYLRDGAIAGIPLPGSLRDGDRLPAPILTASTKAEGGAHDETIDFATVERTVGARLASRLREIALALYARGSEIAERNGIILADTKFEFGLVEGSDDPILIDEVLTPDSSRFWDAATWKPGAPQPSFDKQYVRDWLEATGWDKRPPGPELPLEVVAGTRARYVAAFERITGASFERYLQEDEIGR